MFTFNKERPSGKIRGLGISLIFLASLCVVFSSISYAQDNPIVIENTKRGTDSWKITKPATDLDLQIKGFASATSVNKGQSINFFVSTQSRQRYTIKIYRMGWYNGKRARLMKTVSRRRGINQPAPEIDPLTGMVTCDWSSSYSLKIPNNWTSGIYLAKLINRSGFENYIVFTVRDDSRSADFLYQQPVTTYQAYNAFPAGGIGKSLYNFQSSPTTTFILDGEEENRAVKVSFDRPYSGNGSGQFFDYDLYMIGWLERSGYDVTYSTNIDVHQQGASLLKKYKAFLSVGHDEYWSKEMYDAAETARDAGINLAFLGANDVYWQIRMESSDAGTADRVIVSYKTAVIENEREENVPPELQTILWREVGRAEQALVGVQYLTYNDFMEDGSTNGDFMVANTDHWVYENTGFIPGDTVPGIVGYEVDVLYPEIYYPHPVSDNYTRIGDSFFVDTFGDLEWSESSIYQAPSGAWVFAAGTMSWSWALDKPGFTSAGIQKITDNIFNKFAPPTVKTEVCNTYMSNNTPISWRKDKVYSTLNIPVQGIVTDVNVVELSGKKNKYFKDLQIELKSPTGTKVKILNKCKRWIKEFNFSLDDNASKKISSRKCAPNDSQTYKPYKKLTTFNGQKAQGKWELKVNSKRRGARGSLNSWGLNICTIQ